MPTAIVTSATGITGSAVVQHLLKDSSYTTIYTLSRSQPGIQDARVKHACLDLQASAEEMAKTLSGISADFIYFCAYLANPDEDEAAQINVKQLKRLILTCGFKHYGVHLGLPKQPLLETNPRLEGNIGNTSWPANFYYTQKRILETASAQGNWEWICTLPNDVIGYAKHNFTNEATALALYCTVSKTLPGSRLIYPGNHIIYLVQNCWTSADLHARFCLWAATAPGAGNNIFNVTNGDVYSFRELWPRLAERFGCQILENTFHPTTVQEFRSQSTIIELKTKNPVVVHAESMGLADTDISTRQPVLDLPIDPQKWARRDDVREAWRKLQVKYDLDQDFWDKATWEFLTFVLGREWGCVASMNKARGLGWTGYGDTWESFERTFEMLEREGVIPPMAQPKKDL
ncbi:NAD(P)-binding protein [Aspergillus sclerotiicarbonarius CBS 121057]|uniref:NAD(P)-binding protein n=1 Tax=Aspergillus sclerotiicarbonarius (strain CBS 121057 / IBT 28362) TaxID=1448318 RepID=A0A319E968_ASPSB|nr:NAD(P)-binding protein [Aspergillus sclerotiicarbonarius CBS 121057]